MEPQQRTCRTCGQAYTYVRGDPTAGGYKYCSPECWPVRRRHNARFPCTYGCGRMVTTGACVRCEKIGKMHLTARRIRSNSNITVRRSLTVKWRRQGRKCYWCGINPFEEIDHVIPQARGGHHGEANLVPSCKRCNLARGRMYVIELKWMARHVWGK